MSCGKTRNIINLETVNFPFRHSSRIKSAAKQNDSAPESSLSNIDYLNNYTMTERSRTLRSRRNSGLDEQTSFSKQHTRAGSESKSTPTTARPTRRTRASSMEPAANIDKNQMKTNNSELVHTPINTRKRRSILPAGKHVIEEKEQMMNPVVALERVMTNLKEINETCSESFTTEDVNKSVPVSKNEVDTDLEGTCKEETNADINARKENTNPAENSPIKAVEEVKMDTSINKLIVSDNSESINDSINTTQVESPIEDVTKTQAQKEEVTPRKLGMKNGSYANNSIKEDDEILGNKENQEANIIDNSKNTDVTVSNVLLQSPKLAVSNLCVGKSVKESNENADSSDNMQNVMVTDTDSLNESPLSESMDEKVSCIEVCEDSSLDDNIQILKCPEDVNDMKLSQYSDIEDQNTSSADTNVDKNRDEEIGADKSLRLETSMEELQHITSEDGTINNDKNVGPPLTPKAHTNTHEGDPKDVCLTPIEYASDKCEANEETATSNISKNVTDADIMNCSNWSDISISKTTTSLSLATNDSTKDDSAGIEMVTETPSQENVGKESSDVDIKLTDIETTSVVTDKDNITNETENDKSCSDAQSSAESIEKVLEKDDETLTTCTMDGSMTFDSECLCVFCSNTQNKTEENEIPKMFEKHDEKPEDENQSDSNVSRELFKDISADEWRDKICETNSVHSMSTERLENESENECDDFVLITARKENTNPAENSPIKAVEEVKMDTSINKLIVSDNSESINDSINTTQVESPIEDVTKTQAQKEEVTPRKLGMKNGSYANNSIKEDDEILGNKENQEANIIDNSKNTDVTVSNVLLQSPKLAVSNLCVGKSVKESNENADSSDNMQNVMVTDTDSLNESPLNESIKKKVSSIEVCEDSSLPIQILKCPDNVNEIKLLSLCSEDQNTSADINVDSNRDDEIGADESLRLEDSMEEQLQNITTEDKIINNDKNVGQPLTPKAHTNTHEGDPKDVCLTPIEYASDKCEANEETATSNISKNVTDADIMNCSNWSDISISKTTTSLSLATNDSTKDDSAGIEMVTETPSQENVGKESSDVDIKLTDIETTSVVTDKDNITNETENNKSCSDAQSSAESIDKVLEKDDETLNICKLHDSATSERKSITDSDTQNKMEENEIPKMFEKHDEKPEDENQSDANVSRELFKDISADEWRDKICETNSVHSMSTERLENESENECDDFVLVDKESSQTPENTNIDKEKIALDYDSEDTVLLKTQKDELKEKREESVTVSKVQCEMNKNKLAEVINTRKSMQQEEINEIKSDTNNLEVESQDRKEPMQNQIKDIQNVSPRKASTIEVSNQFTPANTTSIEDSVDRNLLTETDQNLNMPSTESSLNKWNSKNKLNNGLSRKSKSVEKLDDEVEKFGEADTVEEKESLNKSPIDSSSSASDSELFKDISADEWRDKICETNSVHSMSTERLENESENECDDFVLVDKESSQTPENTNIDKEKIALDYDSEDTVLLKTQKDELKEKREESVTVSKVQCEMNKNKLAEVINTRKSMQQEEINEIKSDTNNLEVESQDRKEPMQNQIKDIQNVSPRKASTIEVSNQFTPANTTSIEDSVDRNLLTETDQNLNMPSTESSLNEWNSKNKLNNGLSRKSKSVEKLDDEVEKFGEADTVEEKESLNKSPIDSSSSASDSNKSVEKLDDEVEKFSEADSVEEKESLSKSPINSSSSTSDSNKLNESIDSDIEREYNFHGVEVSKFSDDDVPGDECRASETESSDPDDHGSDLADFVVNDDDDDDDGDDDNDDDNDEIVPSEIDEELSNTQDDDIKNSNENTIDEQCPEMQVQEESEEEEIEKEKQKRTDTNTFRKDKHKPTKSKKLDLSKITSNDTKITNSEIESSKKKKKRKNMIESSDDEVYEGNEENNECIRKLHSRNLVNANETDKTVVNKQCGKVQTQEIKGKVTKKEQEKVGADKMDRVSGIKSTDTTEKGSSKFGETRQLDLSESGKTVKRKSEIEIVSKKIKKNKTKNDDERIQKENAIQIYKNESAKCSTVELSRKGIKRFSDNVIGNLSDVPIKKRKPNEQNLPSRSNPYSVLIISKLNVKPDLILLSSYGSTSNFYVENLRRLKKTKTAKENNLNFDHLDVGTCAYPKHSTGPKFRIYLLSFNEKYKNNMSRCVKNADGEIEVKTGRRTRSIINSETVDSPLRRSSRVKHAGKQNESSPESPPSDNSNINSTPSVRNTRRRIDALNNSALSERSRTLRSRRNSGLDEQTSFSKQHTRAGSESKSPPTAARPTRRTRASSMEPAANIENNDMKTNNSELVHTPINTRKRRSILPAGKPVIEENEEIMNPVVALDRVLPNLQEINETCSESFTTEDVNKSVPVSKNEVDTVLEDTCKEETDADINARKENTNPAENSPIKAVEEVKMDTSINKLIVSDNSESINDSINTTQVESPIEDVTKTQAQKEEVTPRKLGMKNGSYANNSIKEDDEILGNKENQEANIIDNSKNTDVTVSNVLLQSPKLAVSNLCVGKSVKESNENADSSDNIIITARKENTNPAENSPIKAVEEVKMDTSINKLIVSDNSESINDSINTTQVESPIEDVTKTQAQKEEVTPRKLGMKNGSYANNSIKEDDEILGNKENQEANIIDNSKNTDVTVSNVLLQSPKLAVSNLCVGKSVKESNENADSSDNMQNVMVTDTDSLNESPLSESMDEKVSCIEVCEDSSLDDNIQILKCPEDVNDMKLSQYSDIEDQNTSSADTNVDKNRDEEIGADKSLRLETSMEELQHITSEDGTINNDKNVGPPLTPKAHTNTHEGDPKDVCLTPIEYASDKCEANEETATSNISKNVTDADIMNCSNWSDISISKTTTSLSLATNDSTKDDSAGIEMVTETPSQENVGKESSDVDIKLTDIETTSVVTDKDNITNETENDKSCSDAQSSAESIEKVLEKDDETLTTCTMDGSMTFDSECLCVFCSNTQNKTEENEIPKMFEKHDEKPEDENQSDSNVSRELFKDISADEWRDKICETNSVHSMSTERLENESENECDDFVLVDKESPQTPENRNINKKKRALNYDSEDTVLLKTQKDELKEKREESVTVSKVQCEMNKNKLAEVINTRKSMQQEEINEIKSDTNNLEVESQDRKEPMQNQIKDIQNVSPRKASAIEVSNQFTPANTTSIEDSVDRNLLTETDQNLNMPSTESSLNKWNSKNKLNDGLSRKSKSVEKLDDEVEKFGEADTVEEKESMNKSPIDSSSSASDSNKSVEKLDDEVEKFSEADTVEEKESLIKSPIDSSSSASDSNKLNESIDSDIEKEYNLHGVDVSKFSYDDVPGDECRASETESSDPDDHGSDLADFVVNDDDDDIDVDNFEDEEDDDNDNSEVEIELSEIDEELCSTQDDDIKKSNENTIDEQCPKMQVQEESEKEEIEKEKQKRTDTNTFRKDKHKPTKSKKLDLSKITSNDREITNSEIESSKKKKKRKIKIESSDDEVHKGNEENNERNRKLLSRNLVNANEADKTVVNKQYGKMKVQEIKGKVTKKEQEKVGADKKDRVSGIKSTDTTEKRSSKFSETRQLDLSESGKNVKRKSEIEIVSKKIKKNKTKNNDERIQKENAIHTYKNESAKCSTVELSRKGVKRLSDDVIGNLSDVPMKVFQKADLQKLPSRLMPHSLLKKNKINVKQGFMSLSSYGSTSNFYVSNIQKMKKAKITSEVLSFRQNMLNRNPRQPISHYTMFLEKQKASNKH
nr:LOW QUALITY PROTEIN: protein PFC0760c-like [Megalopta genalis]